MHTLWFQQQASRLRRRASTGMYEAVSCRYSRLLQDTLESEQKVAVPAEMFLKQQGVEEGAVETSSCIARKPKTWCYTDFEFMRGCRTLQRVLSSLVHLLV